MADYAPGFVADEPDVSNPAPASRPGPDEQSDIARQNREFWLGMLPPAFSIAGGTLGALTGPAAPFVSPLLAGIGGAGGEAAREFGLGATPDPRLMAFQGGLGLGAEGLGQAARAGLAAARPGLTDFAMKLGLASPELKYYMQEPKLLDEALSQRFKGSAEASRALGQAQEPVAQALSRADQAGFKTTGEDFRGDFEHWLKQNAKAWGPQKTAYMRSRFNEFAEGLPGEIGTQPFHINDTFDTAGLGRHGVLPADFNASDLMQARRSLDAEAKGIYVQRLKQGAGKAPLLTKEQEWDETYAKQLADLMRRRLEGIGGGIGQDIAQGQAVVKPKIALKEALEASESAGLPTGHGSKLNDSMMREAGGPMWRNIAYHFDQPGPVLKYGPSGTVSNAFRLAGLGIPGPTVPDTTAADTTEYAPGFVPD